MVVGWLVWSDDFVYNLVPQDDFKFWTIQNICKINKKYIFTIDLLKFIKFWLKELYWNSVVSFPIWQLLVIFNEMF